MVWYIGAMKLKILSLAVSLVFIFLMIEMGLRLWWPQVYPLHPPGMYELDDKKN